MVKRPIRQPTSESKRCHLPHYKTSASPTGLFEGKKEKHYIQVKFTSCSKSLHPRRKAFFFPPAEPLIFSISISCRDNKQVDGNNAGFQTGVIKSRLLNQPVGIMKHSMNDDDLPLPLADVQQVWSDGGSTPAAVAAGRLESVGESMCSTWDTQPEITTFSLLLSDIPDQL